MWSRNINEIVSTHGYSLNQIIVALSIHVKGSRADGAHVQSALPRPFPDRQTIVTGAGDETLRFGMFSLAQK